MANEFALGTTKKNLQKRLDDLKKFLKVATEGGSIDFARVTFGKSLFVFMKVGYLNVWRKNLNSLTPLSLLFEFCEYFDIYFDILIFDFIKEGCPSTELIYKGPST